MHDVRDEAEQFLRTGICGVAAAFNLGRSREWRFEPDVQERAERMLCELSELFFDSEIRAAPKPAMIPRGDPQAREAGADLEPDRWYKLNRDIAFQTFLHRAFTPVIDGTSEACAQLQASAKYAAGCARISEGARAAWKRRRAKWGKRGRAA
jgi:hypothetical protein